MILRAASSGLKTLLSSAQQFWRADLFTFTLASGTIYRWTSWDSAITVGGHSFDAFTPKLNRGPWSVSNTMTVETLELELYDNTTTAFGSGTQSLRAQLSLGLFDGATCLMQSLIMPQGYPLDVSNGTVDMFFGDVGAIDIAGAKATIKIRSRVSRLSVNAPLNVFQPGCLHTFCDTGCTLSLASPSGGNLTSRTVQASPTPTATAFGWGTEANPTRWPAGTVTFTSGANTGQARTIGLATTTQVAVTYPFPFVPLVGDAFTTTQGCDKQETTCINTYNNLVNFRGFPYIPPTATTAPGP